MNSCQITIHGMGGLVSVVAEKVEETLLAYGARVVVKDAYAREDALRARIPILNLGRWDVEITVLHQPWGG